MSKQGDDDSFCEFVLKICLWHRGTWPWLYITNCSYDFGCKCLIWWATPAAKSCLSPYLMSSPSTKSNPFSEEIKWYESNKRKTEQQLKYGILNKTHLWTKKRKEKKKAIQTSVNWVSNIIEWFNLIIESINLSFFVVVFCKKKKENTSIKHGPNDIHKRIHIQCRFKMWYIINIYRK